MIEMQQSDKRSLRRYLLGEAAPQEQSTIEQRLLSEQEYFDELIKTEEELTDEYVRGELEEPEKKDFELHFVANPERRDRVEFARTLNQYLSQQNLSRQTRGESATNRLRQERHAWWSGLTPARSAAAALAACLLLLLAGGSALLWRQTLHLQGQIEQTELQRAQSQQHQQELMRQIEQQAAQNLVLAMQYERQKEELSQLRLQLARLLRSGTHNPAESTVASLLLTPGIVRDPEPASVAMLSPSIQKLRLNLQVGGARYKSYRAEVQTVEGSAISIQPNLKSHDSGQNRVVTVVLPTASLTRSDYLIMLDGIAENGSSEKVGTYYFKLVRK